MSKTRLVVLFGGISGEHEVSCLSAASILTHLDPHRYEVTAIGVSRAGLWYRQPTWSGGDLRVLETPGAEVWVRPGLGLATAEGPLAVDVVFPIVHGIGGEDGRLQGLLAASGIPYCGAGVLASALGMDKAFAKQIWADLGLPVVPSLTVGVDADEPRADLYRRALATLGFPLFVKPANSGSSVGVKKVTDEAQFGPALDQAFAIDTKVLIETAVDAREIEVAVLGSGRGVRAFGPGEIAPTHEFYDYEAKYLDPDGAALVVPADLPPELSQRILDLACRAYRALGAEGFARVDFFVSRDGAQCWLNEINTLPGFTTISMFPRMALASGLTYGEVLDAIVATAHR